MRNLLTGEEKCFDCSPYAEQPDDEHRPDCRGPYGKYLLYETSYVSKEGYFLPHYRVLNLENGEFSEEMNLKDSQGEFPYIVNRSKRSILCCLRLHIRQYRRCR